MNCCDYEQADHGGKPYVVNVEDMAAHNSNFRTAIWTGCNLQMTVMCIPGCGEIGSEIHNDTDQFIRVEQGNAMLKIGKSKSRMDFCQNMCQGDGIFIPAGTWHNIVNSENEPLKLSSIYAPPNHPKGTVHRTKKDAEHEH
ncbi:MAG: cupin domain-containing protein [Lachnospiraceae bacterium]